MSTSSPTPTPADFPPITSFTGPYFFLSNYYPSEIVYDSIIFPTVEHFYQALKVKDRDKRIEVSKLPTLSHLHRWARQIGLRPDWTEIRLPVLKFAIERKFQPGFPLSSLLLSTGQSELINGGKYKDSFLGASKRGGIWAGGNQLGKVLTERRSELAKQNSRTFCSQPVYNNCEVIKYG